MEQANSFGHVQQSQALASDFTIVKPDAAILDHQHDPVGSALQRNASPRRVGMSCQVAQAFLGYAIETQFDLLGNAGGKGPATELQSDAGPLPN